MAAKESYKHLQGLRDNEEEVDAYLFESILSQQTSALRHFVDLYNEYAQYDATSKQLPVVQRWLGLLFLKPTTFLEESDEEVDIREVWQLWTDAAHPELVSPKLLDLFVQRSITDSQFESVWTKLFTYWRDWCKSIGIQDTSKWINAIRVHLFSPIHH